MDDHIAACEALFGAAKSEFKRLEYFYFHNFIYDHVWTNNQRRHDSRLCTHELLRRYNADYKIVLVGDAAMGPYEITHAGGSVEDWNEEPGSTWFRRIDEHFRNKVWINPAPAAHWRHTASTHLIRDMMGGRMFPLTPDGLGEAMRALI